MMHGEKGHPDYPRQALVLCKPIAYIRKITKNATYVTNIVESADKIAAYLWWNRMCGKPAENAVHEKIS